MEEKRSSVTIHISADIRDLEAGMDVLTEKANLLKSLLLESKEIIGSLSGLVK